MFSAKKKDTFWLARDGYFSTLWIEESDLDEDRGHIENSGKYTFFNNHLIQTLK